MQNGTVIEGNFLNDEFVGDAKVEYGNGDSYVGGFENGEKNGYGELITQNLEYRGHFLNNHFHGQGKLIDRIKRQVIDGGFWGGKPNGDATITNLEGHHIYRGMIKHGSLEGRGDGKGDHWLYHGEWQANQWHGHGLLKLKNRGWSHEGQFKHGIRVVVPNKVLFSAFREEWIDPDAVHVDPKKDDKSKKGPGGNKDTSKETAGSKGLALPGAQHSTTNSNSHLGDEHAAEPKKKLQRHLENIPESEIKVFAGNKEGLNLLIKVVYQGPDYPDPNPPPPDPKKRPPIKKGQKDVVEEPEIPMLTPPPVILKEESGRAFKVELHQLNADGSLGASFKVDYRHELQEMEEFIKEKDAIEQKMKDIKTETPTSRRNILVKKATLSKIEDHNFNLYTPEVHEDSKPLTVASTNGIIEIMGLRYPENFPGGNFRITVTDLSPRTLKFVENLGKKTLDVCIVAKDQPDPTQVKKKATTTQTKKK